MLSEQYGQHKGIACREGAIEGNSAPSKWLLPISTARAKVKYVIPASFSVQLIKGSSDLGLNFGRKLLNTEKLIFKTDTPESLNDQGGLFVLVNVVPEGVVAIPGVQERKYIIFNIVCDELFLGIPHKAWYVVILVLLCLGIAFLIPSFLPPYLLPKNQNPRGAGQVVSKDS